MRLRSGSCMVAAAVAALLGAAVVPAVAQDTVLYGTELSNGAVFSFDVNTSQITDPAFSNFNVNGNPDSLAFHGSNTLIYSSNSNEGEIWSVDLSTGDQALLHHANLTFFDMAVDPTNSTLYFSEDNLGAGTSTIGEINLATNNYSSLVTLSGYAQGLAFANGRLFANIGVNGLLGTSSEVAEIDPLTGSIVATTAATLNGLDGLTYDTYSNKLYAASANIGGVFQIDPTNLSYTLLASNQIGSADGLTTDDAGHLFLAGALDSNGNSPIYQYNIGDGSVTPFNNQIQPDDLAPIAGAGSRAEPLGGSPVPEGKSVAILCAGLLPLGIVLRRRRRSEP